MSHESWNVTSKHSLISSYLVDWRKTVTSTLVHSAANKTSSSSRSAALSPEVRGRLSTLSDKDWAQFAQEVGN
jgi:2-haloacid dehalogenase